jgi:cyclopropane fatty-acyl-phospholipid synthase-like methyltransferase
MADKHTLTLEKISEAITHAAETNPDPHMDDMGTVKKIKSNKHFLKARLRRMQNVVKQLNLRDGGIIADLGSGNAFNSVLSLMCGVSEVHAIEYGEKRYRTAQNLVAYLKVNDRIHLHCHDLLKFDLPPHSIDGTYSSELLKHIADLSKLFSKLNT